MGWDAYAQYNGKDLRRDWGKKQLKAPGLKRIFNKAAKKGADWLLPLGGLDCSCYGTALEEATGLSVYCEAGWDVGLVKMAAENAEWDDVEEQEHVSCAKAFLEACAEAGLSIYFSW